MMKVRFHDIDWDTDGQSVEDCGLPTECVLDIDDELAIDYGSIQDCLAEEGAYLLSDRYGFLVNACKFEIIQQVVVTVEGGVVQHVECPKGIQVVVKDYDVDGCEEADLSEDDNNDKYLEIIWE